MVQPAPDPRSLDRRPQPPETRAADVAGDPAYPTARAGPTTLAILSDYVFGQDRIQLSLVTVGTVTHLLSPILLWAGLEPFVRSLAYLREWEARQ